MNHDLKRFHHQLALVGVSADIEPAGDAAHGVRAGEALLERGRSRQRYTLAYGDRVPLSAAHDSSNRPRLVFADHIPTRTAETYRRAGVQYLDTAGNAWIEFGDVLVDVRGRPPAHARKTRASGNLFSTGRAQVVFALLAWPQLWDATQRDVARASGVSLGQANNALRLLHDAGYDGRPSPRVRTGLLDLWAAAFPTGLAERLTLARFLGDVGPVKPAHDEALYVSGEVAAADLLRPATMIVYVDNLHPRLPLANRWRADGEPNVVVRRAFWRDPADTPDDLHRTGVAPWPLVYADLRTSDDPRARAAASEWRDQHA